MMKRLLDVFVAAIALILLSPLIAIAALLILIVDGRPIFYRQERIGFQEVPFQILKFRTMRKHSDHHSSVTVANDSRILPYCGWLRQYKVDELPQVINVLRGEMSIVGPRPTTLNDVERMTPEQRRRHWVKPGITGLAQINGDTSISWPKRIAFDLAYARKPGVLADLRIILLTAVLLVRGSLNTPPTVHDEWSDTH